MIICTVNDLNEYVVQYRLEGVKALEVTTTDLTVALREVENKLRLEMGLHRGKQLTSKLGR